MQEKLDQITKEVQSGLSKPIAFHDSITSRHKKWREHFFNQVHTPKGKKREDYSRV